MKIFNFAVGVLALVSMAGSVAHANELVVTPVETKGGVSVAFDIVSDGGIAGLNFNLHVPGLKAKSGVVTSCVAELPKGFDGACSIRDGDVAVYATSSSPSIAIPAGVVPVGKITLSYSRDANAIKSGGGFRVSNLAFFDNSATQMPASATIEGSGLRGEEARRK